MAQNLDPTKTKRQEEIVEAWIANNGCGTIRAVTGFGKSRAMLMGTKRCHNSPNAKTNRDVTAIVPHNKLHTDWQERFAETEWKNIPSQVYTIQTLIRRFNEGNPLKTSILLPDEIHRYTSEQFGRLFGIVDYDFIFGGTATLDPEDPKYDIVREKCPVIDTVDLKEARKNGWVSDFNIYNLGIELTGNERRKYKAMTDKFNNYFSTFGWDFDLAKKCVNDDAALRDHANFLGWDLKAVKVHGIQLFKIIQKRKKFLYGLPSKRQVAKQIIDRFSDRIFITFSQSTDFAEKLAEEVGDEAVAYHSNLSTLIVEKEDKNSVVAKAKKIDGKTRYEDEDGNLYTWKQIKKAYPNKDLTRLGKKRRRQRAIKKFEDGRYKIRVVSTAKALDEGVDFPDVNASIVASGTSKTRQSIQRLGRMIRAKEGKNAFQVELYVKDTQDEKWLRKRQQESINIKWIDSINEINT